MVQLTSISVGQVFFCHGSQVKVRAGLGEGLVQVEALQSGELSVVSVGNLLPILTNREENTAAKRSAWLSYDMDNKARRLALTRFNAIKSVLSKNLDKKEVVSWLQADLRVSLRTVYRYLSKYNEDLGPICLMDETRGRSAGAKLIDKQVESIIKYCITSSFQAGERFTYEKVLERVGKMCRISDLKCPSIKTIKARSTEYGTNKQLAKIRIGPKRATDEMRAKTGSCESRYPLEIVQIDHSRVDIILVDEAHRKPIGRPWVTFAIDTHTRIILGVYLSWSAPSRYTVACCIANMCSPKDQWLELIGCADINYPFYGVPKILQSDNASEFKTPNLVYACDAHGMTMTWRKEKHYGGHIERYIGSVMGQVHFLKGTTFSNTIEKGDYDSEKNACYTFSEFRSWLLGEIERYHIRHHKGLKGKSPKFMWENHFVRDDGSSYSPPLITDARSFKLDFMPRKTVTIRSVGVVLEYIRYWDNSLRNLIGNSYTCVYNPESLKVIWLKIDGKYRDVPYANLTHPDVSLDQVKKARKESKALGTDPRDEIRQFELMDRSERIEASALAKSKAARKNKNRKELQLEHYLEPDPRCVECETERVVTIVTARRVYFDV